VVLLEIYVLIPLGKIPDCQVRSARV